jgi:hypothetical protein
MRALTSFPRLFPPYFHIGVSFCSALIAVYICAFRLLLITTMTLVVFRIVSLLGFATPRLLSRIVTHRRSYLQTLEEYIHFIHNFTQKIQGGHLKRMGPDSKRIGPSATVTMQGTIFQAPIRSRLKTKSKMIQSRVLVLAHTAHCISLSPYVRSVLPVS